MAYYTSVVISSGHGLYVRGASSPMLDEVDEARIVVDALADELIRRGVEVVTFHDDTSRDQSTNLSTITRAHNAEERELDISVHFNAYEQVDHGMGVEVLYYSDGALAAELSAAIADASGLIDRGAKQRQDLYVLANTEEKCVLLEVAFCDSETDVRLYRENFDAIIDALAYTISGVEGDLGPPQRPERPERPEPPDNVLFHAVGKMSYFGGPDDEGVSDSEGLAFHSELTEDNQHLFLPYQPDGTSGLARRLNPFINYVAARWDYNITPKAMLATSGERALVRSIKTGRAALAFPSDWGPHEDTGRVADLSPGLCEVLDLETDDECEVIYPYREG